VSKVTVYFTKPATYQGIKEREAVRSDMDQARLVLRQTGKGSNQWTVFNRHYSDSSARSGPTTPTHRQYFTGTLAEAKAEATRILQDTIGVVPGGKLIRKHKNRSVVVKVFVSEHEVTYKWCGFQGDATLTAHPANQYEMLGNILRTLRDEGFTAIDLRYF
jgi:hypothetical protein